MPPLVSKSKIKGREGRRSSSRHTTPSSTISAPLASPTPTNTAFLEIPINHLVVPANIKYDDILERHGGSGGIPDPKHLETIANDLKMLAQLAKDRSEYNDIGMRELSKRRKEALEEEREREQATRERERKEKETARREAEEQDEAREKKSGKAKKKEKERSRVREEKPQDRPLNHGAHGVARQDGLDLPLKGAFDSKF